MSNKRIDLTPEALKKGFTDAIYKELEKTLEEQMAWPDRSDIELEADEILFILENSGFLAELKRCYDREDKANEVMLSARELLMYHYDIFVQFTHTTDLQDEEILDAVNALRKASK
jgi:hypothetical protein